MKSLTFNFRNALSALLCCVALATLASAQEAAPSWVKVAPPNEAFTVLMPRMPLPVAEQNSSGELKVVGQRYSLRHDNAEYMVWSFKAAKLPASLSADVETYLDRCAEIAWNLMIEPYWKKLKRESPEELLKYHLVYYGDLHSSVYLARRYRLILGEQEGMAHIYAVGSQIYIVAAAGAARESASVEEFIRSFILSLPVPEAPVRLPEGMRRGVGTGGGMGVGSGTGSGIGPGTGGGGGMGIGTGGGVGTSGVSGGKATESDDNLTFTAREVTRKAQILTKPEPLYTEWARKFSVTGTVRMRLILKASGEVGGIRPITKLPHGLTQQAIDAARKISFTPAEKDGRKVAQYITFEYNFNIY